MCVLPAVDAGGRRPPTRQGEPVARSWVAGLLRPGCPACGAVSNKRLMFKPLGLRYFAAGAVSNTPTGRRLQ